MLTHFVSFQLIIVTLLVSCLLPAPQHQSIHAAPLVRTGVYQPHPALPEQQPEYDREEQCNRPGGRLKLDGSPDEVL